MQLERSGKVYPEIEKEIRSLQSTLDLTKLDIITNTDMKISHLLLLYIGKQSSAIPEYCNTMIGFYATVFYSQYDKSYPLTLEWVGNQVGKGKIVGFRQFFPWASVAKNANNQNIFTLMKGKDLYTAGDLESTLRLTHVKPL